MNVGMILAGGKGKRFGAEETGKNKVASEMEGKPLVMYGVDLFEKTMDHTMVVVGVMAESVKAAIGDRKVEYAYQDIPRGTGDAVKAGVARIEELGWTPGVVVVGYADHMMRYSEKTVQALTEALVGQDVLIAMVSTVVDDPNSLVWGRIVRNSEGEVVKIVEQKDASEEERKICEVNAGFYAFEYNFLKKAIGEIIPSPVSGEYYLTDVVEAAGTAGGRIVAVQVPFDGVGWGVNTREELQKDVQLAESH